MIYRKPGGTYVVTDYPLEGWVEVSQEEYDRYLHPTEAQARANMMADTSISDGDKRKALYQTIRHKLLADWSEDETQPFFNPPKTVDEMQAEYAMYLGDDDEYAETVLVAKKAAKTYIRTLTGGE